MHEIRPQPGRTASTRQVIGVLRRFRRDPSGASAVEFALIAFPLILLLLAALEVGIVYFANFALENATSQGARLIRTGQASVEVDSLEPAVETMTDGGTSDDPRSDEGEQKRGWHAITREVDAELSLREHLQIARERHAVSVMVQEVGDVDGLPVRAEHCLLIVEMRATEYEVRHATFAESIGLQIHLSLWHAC